MRTSSLLALAALGIAVVLLVIVREPVFHSIGKYLAASTGLRKTDIVHVISGADWRADYGIELIEAGYAQKIFFTGGWCDEIQGLHGERGRERALAQGLDPSWIAIDDSKVVSTYQEALLLKTYLDQHEQRVKSVMVVSDPFHMRRVGWTYRRVLGPSIEVILAPVPFERTTFQERWWRDPDSARNVGEEYFKLTYSILRYQLAVEPLRGWLASLDVK